MQNYKKHQQNPYLFYLYFYLYYRNVFFQFISGTLVLKFRMVYHDFSRTI